MSIGKKKTISDVWNRTKCHCSYHFCAKSERKHTQVAGKKLQLNKTHVTQSGIVPHARLSRGTFLFLQSILLPVKIFF